MFGPTAGKIRPAFGDSALPAAPISWGSLFTASVSPAVQRAADSAKKKLIQFAVRDKKSPFGGMKPEEVSYENGVIAESVLKRTLSGIEEC